MSHYTGLLDCEQTCIENCAGITDFNTYNYCVEECMFHCVTAKEKPARIMRQ